MQTTLKITCEQKDCSQCEFGYFEIIKNVKGQQVIKKFVKCELLEHLKNTIVNSKAYYEIEESGGDTKC
ncbi:MAG: hypothetical protein MJ060_04320 [Clostridia bacterium]|nr:hypothetical protein [Clostridia bacterium]